MNIANRNFELYMNDIWTQFHHKKAQSPKSDRIPST